MNQSKEDFAIAIVKILRANVDNPRVSNEAFRSFTKSSIEVYYKEHPEEEKE